jgi:hypothetical protein
MITFDINFQICLIEKTKAQKKEVLNLGNHADRIFGPQA